MVSHSDIPSYVLRALQEVEDQLPPDCFEADTVLTFVHLFGYDDACSWLQQHRDLYFDALSQTLPSSEPLIESS